MLVVAAAGLLRWRRPAWYWLTFGVTLATRAGPGPLRLGHGRLRADRPAAALAAGPGPGGQPAGPESRPPRILRLRPTRTGLVLRLKLRPGQDAFDVAAAADRLRHSFGDVRRHLA